MRILAISQFYTPDITAAAFRVSETVDYLREMGHEVQVVTTYPHKSDVELSGEAGNEYVYRLRLPATENKGFLGYIYLYLSFMLKSIFTGLWVGWQSKPDILWATSPPLFAGMAGWVVARILGARFVLDIRDVWPDSAVAAGQLSQSGIGYGVGRWMEKFLYRHADLISCVAEPMKEYIKKHTDTPVEVVYNGMDLAGMPETLTIDESGHSPLESATSRSGSRKIVYAGNFGHVQQIDILVEAMWKLGGSLNHDWEVFLIGDGAQKSALLELVKEYGLTDVIHFIDPVPKVEVFGYLKSADLLFIHLMDSEVLRLTIPSKVFDYMIVDRPMLVGIRGQGEQIVSSKYGNTTFRPGDLDDLISSLENIDSNIDTYLRKVSNSDLIREIYNRKAQSEKLNTRIMEMLH